MKKTILAALASAAVVGLAVTPAAAAVTALPEGQELVHFDWESGIVHFYNSDWTDETRFEPIPEIQNGIVGATFNPADGLLYVVTNWFDSDNQRIASIDPTDGTTHLWDLDYDNSGDTTGYETRALAFDGEGNLWVAAVPPTDLGNIIMRISLSDPSVAENVETINIDEFENNVVSGLAWNPVDESFYFLTYTNDLAKLNSDGTFETPEVTPYENGDDEAADLAFDANGVAWISGDYGDYIASYVPGDPTSGSVVAVGVGMEAIAIVGQGVASDNGGLADTGIDGSTITLGSLAGVAAVASGAWFLRRREVRK